jgi:hypothetical protein
MREAEPNRWKRVITDKNNRQREMVDPIPFSEIIKFNSKYKIWIKLVPKEMKCVRTMIVYNF